MKKTIIGRWRFNKLCDNMRFHYVFSSIFAYFSVILCYFYCAMLVLYWIFQVLINRWRLRRKWENGEITQKCKPQIVTMGRPCSDAHHASTKGRLPTTQKERACACLKFMTGRPSATLMPVMGPGLRSFVLITIWGAFVMHHDA